MLVQFILRVRRRRNRSVVPRILRDAFDRLCLYLIGSVVARVCVVFGAYASARETLLIAFCMVKLGSPRVMADVQCDPASASTPTTHLSQPDASDTPKPVWSPRRNDELKESFRNGVLRHPPTLTNRQTHAMTFQKPRQVQAPKSAEANAGGLSTDDPNHCAYRERATRFARCIREIQLLVRGSHPTELDPLGIVDADFANVKPPNLELSRNGFFGSAPNSEITLGPGTLQHIKVPQPSMNTLVNRSIDRLVTSPWECHIVVRPRRESLPAGDVKYHAGAQYVCPTPSGKKVSLSLFANPSHLKAEDPVVFGKTHAIPHFENDEKEHNTAIGLLHGDCGRWPGHCLRDHGINRVALVLLKQHGLLSLEKMQFSLLLLFQ
ncbi:hypothetical protein NMY22_g3755 [Coprinellus aureogranulatus]|nr:hypothetical protein NMY22_g3755 [Coprinellus aureogranulatus]